MLFQPSASKFSLRRIGNKSSIRKQVTKLSPLWLTGYRPRPKDSSLLDPSLWRIDEISCSHSGIVSWTRFDQYLCLSPRGRLLIAEFAKCSWFYRDVVFFYPTRNSDRLVHPAYQSIISGGNGSFGQPISVDFVWDTELTWRQRVSFLNNKINRINNLISEETLN